MPKFKKKPVIIEAVQFTGDNWEELVKFITVPFEAFVAEQYILIPTGAGDYKADLNDWIIKGVHGEFYPCEPDIFEETYEEVLE